MNNQIKEKETRLILYYYFNQDINNEVVVDKDEIINTIPIINKSDIPTLNSNLSKADLIETKQGSKIIKLKYPNIVDIYPQLNFTYLCDKFDCLKELSYKEKQLLGFFIFIAENQKEQYTTMQMLQKVINTSNNKLNQFLEQFSDKGILDYTKGEKGKGGFRFELKIENPTIEKIETLTNGTNNGTINNIQNQYNYDSNTLDKILQEIQGLKKSLCFHIEKYNRVIDGVSEKLLQRIDDLEHDIDNLFYINNISVPERTKYNIQDIRKYIDDIFNS